jgi:DNA mismatch endonuclease (patch repair protein)
MADVFTSEQRSSVMRSVGSKDTKPEMQVRRAVHAMGFRYRLHVANLAGKPDLVFPRLRSVIFVHGCFWHRHRCRRGRRIPKTNREYWETKLSRNVERDRKNRRLLRVEGWRVLVVWECQLSKDGPRVENRMREFLDDALA